MNKKLAEIFYKIDSKLPCMGIGYDSMRGCFVGVDSGDIVNREMSLQEFIKICNSTKCKLEDVEMQLNTILNGE